MKKNNNYIGYYIVSNILSFVGHILFLDKVVGKENIPKSGSFILAGNHTSNLDAYLLFRANKPVGSEVALALVNNKEIPLDQLPTEIYKYLKKIKPELKEEPEEVRAATKYDIDNF